VVLLRRDDQQRSPVGVLDVDLCLGPRIEVGVFELGELGVRPAILADRELGDELKRRYLDPLMDSSDIAQTLVETTRRYLENGMRVEATAKAMFLHANTLRYRLRRFEELTRCDLKDPDRRMEVWWALEKARVAAAAATNTS
jgi:DNA-binding PucR family transcriptional regulator